jgi:hypothetical protein
MTTKELNWDEEELGQAILPQQVPDDDPAGPSHGAVPVQSPTVTEHARLQGMSHGVEAYNEAIGSPLETEWND